MVGTEVRLYAKLLMPYPDGYYLSNNQYDNRALIWYQPLPEDVPVLNGEEPMFAPHFPYGYNVEPDE